jgi:hypothetical protein
MNDAASINANSMAAKTLQRVKWPWHVMGWS